MSQGISGLAVALLVPVVAIFLVLTLLTVLVGTVQLFLVFVACGTISLTMWAVSEDADVQFFVPALLLTIAMLVAMRMSSNKDTTAHTCCGVSWQMRPWPSVFSTTIFPTDQPTRKEKMWLNALLAVLVFAGLAASIGEDSTSDVFKFLLLTIAGNFAFHVAAISIFDGLLTKAMLQTCIAYALRVKGKDWETYEFLEGHCRKNPKKYYAATHVTNEINFYGQTVRLQVYPSVAYASFLATHFIVLPSSAAVFAGLYFYGDDTATQAVQWYWIFAGPLAIFSQLSFYWLAWKRLRSARGRLEELRDELLATEGVGVEADRAAAEEADPGTKVDITATVQNFLMRVRQAVSNQKFLKKHGIDKADYGWQLR